MEAKKDAKLTRLHHPFEITRIPCAKGTYFRIQRIAQREIGNQLHLICSSQFVSKHHCEITRRDDAYWIKDLGSTNGTFLNGQKLVPKRERELRFKDIIGIGISHCDVESGIDVKDPKYYIFNFEQYENEEVIELDDELSDNENVKNESNVNEPENDEIQFVEEIQLSKASLTRAPPQSVPSVSQPPKLVSLETTTKQSVSTSPQLPKTKSSPPAFKQSVSPPVKPVPIPTPSSSRPSRSLSPSLLSPPLPKPSTSKLPSPSSDQTVVPPSTSKQSSLPKKLLPPAPPPPRISELPKSSPQASTSTSRNTSSIRLEPASNETKIDEPKNGKLENFSDVRFDSALSDISSIKSEPSPYKRKLDKVHKSGRKWNRSSSDDSSDGLGDMDRTSVTKHRPTLNQNGINLDISSASDNENNEKSAFKSSNKLHHFGNNKISKIEEKTPLDKILEDVSTKPTVLLKLQQAIVYQNGCFQLTKEVYDATNTSSKKRMGTQFYLSLKANKPKIAQRIKTESKEENEELCIDFRIPNLKRKSPTPTGTGSDSDVSDESVPSPIPKSTKRLKVDSNANTFAEEEETHPDRGDTHRELLPLQSSESRHKTNTNSTKRAIKLIDTAPLPRFAAAAQRKSATFAHPVRPDTRPNKSSVTPATSHTFKSPNQKEPSSLKEIRSEKLRGIELQRQQEKSKVPSVPTRQNQPAKVKMTNRSRSHGLMESIIGSSETKATSDKEAVKKAPLPVKSNPSPSPLDPRIRNTRDINVPSAIPSTSHAAPLMPSGSIVSKIALNGLNLPMPCDTNKLTGRTEPRFTSSTTNSSVQPSHLKKGAEVILSPPCGIGRVAYKESKSSSSVQSHDRIERKPMPPIFDEEDIYRRIIVWNVSWIKEQNNSNEPPPVHEGLTMSNACVRYDNFKEYANILYPFLLSEIWAVVNNEIEKAKIPSASSHKKTAKYSIKIDKITRFRKFHCDVKVNSTSADEEFCDITYHTWAKNNSEIEPRKDLCILTLSGKDKTTNKEVQKFAICKFNSARYDQVGPNVQCDSRLSGTGGFRFTETIWCRISRNFVVDFSKLGTLEKISYIAPKIREFRAMNQLQSSKLFHQIMSPPLMTKPWQEQEDGLVKFENIITINRNFNRSQLAIANHVASNIMSDKPELMLLHGPPGTGKTTTIVGLVLQIFHSYQHWCTHLKRKPVAHPRILISTPSNAAIDEIMRRLIDAMKRQPASSGNKLSVLRIGDTVSPEFRDYTINHRAQEKEEEKSSTKSLRAELASLNVDIEEVKKEIQDLKSTDSSLITLQAKLFKQQELENKRTSVKNDLCGTGKKHGGHTRADTSNSAVLREANVICSTLSGSSNYLMKKVFGNSTCKEERPFLLCIVDEASQTTELETLLPFMLNINKVLLVGDPHQLGATVFSNEAAKKDFGWSLFTRLFKYYERPEHRNNSPVMMLQTQYRMHADILKYPNAFFYDNKLETQYRVPLDNFPLRPYLFINVPSNEISDKGGQIENTDEILIVKSLIETLEDKLTRIGKSWTMGIITPYTAQKDGIKGAIQKNRIERPSGVFPKINVDTVDGFQGQEKDIIVLSCVRTDAIGFLKSANRLNVALTRAKHCLYIIGDSRCLSKDANWKVLIKEASERNCKYDVNSNFKADIKMLKNNLINVLASRI